jgi:hypothetical protein
LHYIFIQPDLLFVFLWPLNFLYLRSSLIPFDSRFSPEAINWLFDKGLRDWFGQDALFKPAKQSLELDHSIEFQHPFLSLLWELISSELSSLGFFFFPGLAQKLSIGCLSRDCLAGLCRLHYSK